MWPNWRCCANGRWRRRERGPSSEETGGWRAAPLRSDSQQQTPSTRAGPSLGNILKLTLTEPLMVENGPVLGENRGVIVEPPFFLCLKALSIRGLLHCPGVEIYWGEGRRLSQRPAQREYASVCGRNSAVAGPQRGGPL